MPLYKQIKSATIGAYDLRYLMIFVTNDTNVVTNLERPPRISGIVLTMKHPLKGFGSKIFLFTIAGGGVLYCIFNIAILNLFSPDNYRKDFLRLHGITPPASAVNIQSRIPLVESLFRVSKFEYSAIGGFISSYEDWFSMVKALDIITEHAPQSDAWYSAPNPGFFLSDSNTYQLQPFGIFDCASPTSSSSNTLRMWAWKTPDNEVFVGVKTTFW